MSLPLRQTRFGCTVASEIVLRNAGQNLDRGGCLPGSLAHHSSPPLKRLPGIGRTAGLRIGCSIGKTERRCYQGSRSFSVLHFRHEGYSFVRMSVCRNVFTTPLLSARSWPSVAIFMRKVQVMSCRDATIHFWLDLLPVCYRRVAIPWLVTGDLSP